MAQERVFPIFLDGSVQNIDGSTNTAWDGKTSRVVVTSTGNITVSLADASVPGSLVNVIDDRASGTHTTTVEVASPLASSAAFNQFLLNEAGDSITLMWTGSEWFPMGATETVQVQ